MPVGLQSLPAPFFAVHYGEDAQDSSARVKQHTDRRERGLPGGDDILHHHDVRTGLKAPLDLATGPMLLGLFAYGKRVELPARPMGGGCQGIGDRVGAQREATNRARLPAPLVQPREGEGADQVLTFPGHRGESGIDVIGTTAA